ncbi:Ctr copper transporter [Stachybotrys elegans]|uniref:Copper transport protein n=1 Tax=Stachybotrys elegans TaxID=80388 RepID=A0A8K0SI25_9HYPO|nr:Ctr copper transporter [Stachybotrys elegans]
MLWNWNTIDSCFISDTWRIRSNGMFAGSCIGVVLLVLLLEFLRRAVKEYDRFLVRKNMPAESAVAANAACDTASKSPSQPASTSSETPITAPARSGYRPNVFEQAIRALLHMLQFAVAYFIMLLAMYYNGYIIICIFIGAYLGSFIFQWETLAAQDRRQTSASSEATVCCG